MEHDKQELKWIKRIQKRHNDEIANMLISSYYDEIYIYSYKQTFNKETAMDLTQDIFIAVLRSINSYNPKKSSFRTWLYKIATNKVIDYKRKNQGTSKNLFNFMKKCGIIKRKKKV